MLEIDTSIPSSRSEDEHEILKLFREFSKSVICIGQGDRA